MDSPFFDGEPRPKTASFEGRLRLQAYMFSPAASAPHPGGSPAATAATAAARLEPPSPAPLRRSPRNSTPLGPVPSPNRVTKQRTAVAGSKPAACTPGSPAPSPSTGDLLSPKPEFSDSDPTDLATTLTAVGTPARKPKRKRKTTGYAPPSTYAHLPPLTDILAPRLLILFVGLNPGIRTATLGHAYAHPSNLFWKLLYSSGITPRLCHPTEDRDLPRLYGLGNTNIVSRPSRNGAELSKAEMDAGVAVLEEKVRGCRPEAVCIVGKGIWESVWRVRRGRGIRKEEFRYGWQDEGENMGVVVKGEDGGDDDAAESDLREAWAGARVFVATSTSGLAATLRPAEKEKIWRELGEWCEGRRAARTMEA